MSYALPPTCSHIEKSDFSPIECRKKRNFQKLKLKLIFFKQIFIRLLDMARGKGYFKMGMTTQSGGRSFF